MSWMTTRTVKTTTRRGRKRTTKTLTRKKVTEKCHFDKEHGKIRKTKLMRKTGNLMHVVFQSLKSPAISERRSVTAAKRATEGLPIRAGRLPTKQPLTRCAH